MFILSMLSLLEICSLLYHLICCSGMGGKKKKKHKYLLKSPDLNANNLGNAQACLGP